MTITRGAESKPASTGAAPAAKEGKKCLDCHGPFDKLVKLPAKFSVPGAEKINPHRYVPHTSKLEKDIPSCTRCHTAHALSPLPAKGSIDLSKVTVKWCFSCHHQKNFQTCKDCHP